MREPYTKMKFGLTNEFDLQFVETEFSFVFTIHGLSSLTSFYLWKELLPQLIVSLESTTKTSLRINDDVVLKISTHECGKSLTLSTKDVLNSYILDNEEVVTLVTLLKGI